MNMVYLVCNEDITLTVLEKKSREFVNITLEKGKDYKGIEDEDVFSLFGETKKGETQFYQFDIQEVVRLFTAKDCSILAGNGETEFRLRPEKYQGYRGTYHWNAKAQIYEGEVLDIEEKVTYTGKDLLELNNHFKVAVDSYLENLK